ncbi:MAG: HEPN domain-containing protein [Bacteroidales bacterium]|nr:HEPN domain-containing protein [Bacteroidales bacterium]MBD5282859.1 HEPN domain-containing protein [Bacteroides sp.]MBD5293621.1 HEPN domain-containing protein [Bacteroides sp.]MBD5342805.1 HEPN domain-containing protein [Bacteroides sp.]MBD5352701.1 HEPN domain-containing protein [Bacteroides sp.]
MNESLDSGTQNDLINYRLKRSIETLEEADYNARGGYFNAAVNRLYYACYYAASALMLYSNLEASTHKGIKTMLGLHFIKPGLLEAKYGRIYQQLYENRQSGDYEDFVYCDEELFAFLRPQAEDFVKKISKHIS